MKKLLLPAFAVLAAASAHAQLSYDTIGSVYTQDFNTLIQTGSGVIPGRGPFDVTTGNLSSGSLPGWTFSNYLGTNEETEWKAQNGSLSGSSGRGVVSFGLTGDSDRALGTLATDKQIGRFGLTIQNNTGSILDSFSLSYDGEIWRSGGGTPTPVTNNLFFSYAIVSSSPSINGTGFTDVASLTYTMTAFSPFETAVNGNLNPTFLSDTIGGLTWNPGDYLIVRWSGQDASGQDNGLAVDNITFSATAVPEPTTWALLGLGAAGVFALRRLRVS